MQHEATVGPCVCVCVCVGRGGGTGTLNTACRATLPVGEDSDAMLKWAPPAFNNKVTHERHTHLQAWCGVLH
jgi:hypothetical protein